MNKLTKHFVCCYCVLLFTIGLVPSAFATHSFLVAPPHLSFDLKQPKTQLLLLQNNGTEIIHLSIKSVYYPVNAVNMKMGKSLDPNIKQKENISPYILYSPRVVSLQPQQEREIRVMVRMPHNPKIGEYRAHLLIHMMEPVHVETAKKKTKENKTINMRINMLLQMAIPVYARFGNGQATLKIRCNKNKKGQMQLTVINNSSWRFLGKLKIKDKNHKKVAKDNLVILRNSKQILVLKYKPKPGRYIISWSPKEEELGKAGSAVCKVR